jgi:MFS family permease
VLLAVVLPALVARQGDRGRGDGGEGGRAPTVLRDPAVLSILASVALGAWALSFLEPMLPLHLTATIGAGPLAIGLLFGLATLANAVASVAVGRLSDRCPDARPAGTALVVISAATAAMALPLHLTAVAGLLVVLGVAYAGVLVPALSRLATVVSTGVGPDAGPVGQRLGGVYAAFNIAYAVGMGAGPLIGGVLAARTGTGTAFLVAGVIVAGITLTSTAVRHPVPADPSLLPLDTRPRSATPGDLP